MIWPAWAAVKRKENQAKLAKLGRRVFDIVGHNDEETSIIAIGSMRDFFISIGMPQTLNELGLSESDIDPLVNLATGNRTRVIGCYPQSLEAEDVMEIFSRLLKTKE